MHTLLAGHTRTETVLPRRAGKGTGNARPDHPHHRQPRQAREYEALLGVQVTAAAELTEVQSLDVAQVAARKARDAYAHLGVPVLVDDTGLSIHAWNGLPGALVAWFLDTVGPSGILAMAAGLTDRRATVTTALGYADATGVRVFQGTLPSTLATEPCGTSGFGYDAIFVPALATRPSPR